MKRTNRPDQSGDSLHVRTNRPGQSGESLLEEELGQTGKTNQEIVNM